MLRVPGRRLSTNADIFALAPKAADVHVYDRVA